MAASSSTAAATAVSGPTTTRGNSMLPGPPPPTPSNHQQLPSANAAGGTDAALSAFLHRMLLSSPAPPLRSPPVARSQSTPSLPPLVSLDSPDPRAILDAAGTGYFHLAGHGVPSELLSSALAEIAQIDDASKRRQSNLRVLGFSEEEDADGGADDPAMVFDAGEVETDDALPAAAAEYARRMRDVGMRVVEMLSGCGYVGFLEDPFADGRRKARCLVWASKVSGGETAPPAAGKAKAYPYIVGLHCQWEATGREAAPASWVMDDGGAWTAVGARDGALLVTIGDIAQVWSNGKLKKVRGMARPTSSAPSKDGQQRGEPDRLSVTVLITLPLDSVISPLVPYSAEDAGDDGRDDETAGEDGGDEWRFQSFLLEDYAWRVYHQRLQFKDPLVRYRI
ncbi:hypothetical protein PR202_ga09159 [Eleusine coracana subsp. coracana]|uniref:Isopenicillin N synthase-like Fe(2+) 2OG dioxygenase domain-containing protein n=1 Tax=Eleusine coracana subsp. coracana TaxID=191504 RepID=A0AAV5C233_ELECO|nr:hypothetical protein QOZ80_1AG0038700 [Eleusine coracana subsp. coracana]GJM92668.1 hypothetical protein PR202_ga09159 [Eleusine coracana subsp. coracana]